MCGILNHSIIIIKIPYLLAKQSVIKNRKNSTAQIKYTLNKQNT